MAPDQAVKRKKITGKKFITQDDSWFCLLEELFKYKHEINNFLRNAFSYANLTSRKKANASLKITKPSEIKGEKQRISQSLYKNIFVNRLYQMWCTINFVKFS